MQNEGLLSDQGYVTCADCAEYTSCETIQHFVRHPGYKCSKYRQALELIRAHGYQAFLDVAQNWKGAYGKYDSR